ncbi:MAG: hypothetical protein O3B99_04030 [Proteobacteria bacterium]|nr:hypothetical protein [Pseudomonadota bacterium]MDA1321439.1 hypothetical protein [Pseudomonadota bacterium]
MSQRWAIVCGLIRDEQAFQAQLASLRSWKARGDIEDIVVSTWRGEIDRYPAAKEAHARGEFILVESEQPILKTNGYTMHQSRSLYYALQAVPDGAMVLKLRPDIALINEVTRAAVLSTDLTLNPKPGWPEIFNQKILVAAYFVDSPFYINDILYYGQREDLLRLASFDLGVEMTCTNMAPEQFFFRGAFANACPLIEAYNQVSPFYYFGDEEGGIRRRNTLLASDAFLDVLAVSTRWMEHYFRVGFISEPHRESLPSLPDGFSLAELLGSDSGLPGTDYQSAAHAVTAVDENIIHGLLQQKFSKDALGLRMIEALERTASPNYWLSTSNNPLRPSQGIRDLQYALADTLGPRSLGYIHRLSEQVDDRTYRVRGHVERLSLTIESDQTRLLTEEINHMRRLVDDLQIRLRKTE